MLGLIQLLFLTNCLLIKALKIKKANQISHRYDCLPLLPSGPGGVRQELVVSICRLKVNIKV